MRLQPIWIALFLLLLSSPPLWSQTSNLTSENSETSGEIRYIIDDLYTYMHSGPGRNYRIIGSINAGSKVNQLSINTESNYIEIIDDKNRRGWVDGRHIATTESIRERLVIIEQQLAFSGEQVADKQEEIESLQNQLTTLNSEYAELEAAMKTLQNQFEDAQDTLSNRGMEEQKQWFITGGAFGVGCILLGVILSLVLKRKRREDTWM